MDVDALSHRFEPLIAKHCTIAHILHSVGLSNRPEAYDNNKFSLHGKTKIEMVDKDDQMHVPIIIQSHQVIAWGSNVLHICM